MTLEKLNELYKKSEFVRYMGFLIRDLGEGVRGGSCKAEFADKGKWEIDRATCVLIIGVLEDQKEKYLAEIANYETEAATNAERTTGTEQPSASVA